MYSECRLIFLYIYKCEHEYFILYNNLLLAINDSYKKFHTLRSNFEKNF